MNSVLHTFILLGLGHVSFFPALVSSHRNDTYEIFVIFMHNSVISQASSQQTVMIVLVSIDARLKNIVHINCDLLCVRALVISFLI